MTVDYDDEPQSAILLTEQEWEDLAVMARHTMLCCNGPACDHQPGDQAQRIRLLAGRIITAAASG